ncbi:hypothetical protein ABZ845_31850, partial [Streptomyces sp. NPDC047022]
TGVTYDWGRSNYVRLTPGERPAHVLTVLRPSVPHATKVNLFVGG